MQTIVDLNSELSFSQIGCPSKTKEAILPYYLSIADGWQTFTMDLWLFKGQSRKVNRSKFRPRNWTRVADSISNNDNR